MSSKPSVLTDSLAGMAAGTVEVLAMQPLDLLKTRLQSSRVADLYAKQSTFGAFRRIVSEEGVLALYKGIVPMLSAVVPRVTLQYFGLSLFQPRYEKMAWLPVPASVATGISTGIVQAVLLVTPLELIKVRQQTQLATGAQKYAGQISTARLIIAEEGVLSLWKGLSATAIRQAWGLMIKFTGYLEIRKLFERLNAAQGREGLAPWQPAVAGGCSNVIVGILNAPPDTIKTRLQDTSAVYKGTWDCVKSMVRNEGVLSLFKGAWLRVLRIAPGGALQFAAFEQFRTWKVVRWAGGSD